jgi:hypothetical protein
MKQLEVSHIQIGIEEIQQEKGGDRSVSTIEITFKKQNAKYISSHMPNDYPVHVLLSCTSSNDLVLSHLLT